MFSKNSTLIFGNLLNHLIALGGLSPWLNVIHTAAHQSTPSLFWQSPDKLSALRQTFDYSSDIKDIIFSFLPFSKGDTRVILVYATDMSTPQISTAYTSFFHFPGFHDFSRGWKPCTRVRLVYLPLRMGGMKK